jgi:hypothetical protein
MQWQLENSFNNGIRENDSGQNVNQQNDIQEKDSKKNGIPENDTQQNEIQ